MCCTHSEGKSVIDESIMKILRAKIYKKWQLMAASFILVVWIK